MEEITKAIAKIKEIKTDDADILKGLGELQNILSEANKKDGEFAERHKKLIDDYRDLIASTPTNTPTPKAAESPNPPPVEKKLPTFDEALSNVLANRSKK